MSALIPRADADLRKALNRFVTTAAANAAELGFTEEEIAAITTLQTVFEEKTDDVAVKQAMVSQAIQSRKDARSAVEALVRSFARKIEARSGVSTGLIEALGMPRRDTQPTVTTPETPTDLLVFPTADGVNTVRWKANGNKFGTQYILEAKVREEGFWAFLHVTTAKRHRHVGQTPGQTVYYRVKAQRAKLASQYSNDAVAYGP